MYHKASEPTRYPAARPMLASHSLGWRWEPRGVRPGKQPLRSRGSMPLVLSELCAREEQILYHK